MKIKVGLIFSVSNSQYPDQKIKLMWPFGAKEAVIPSPRERLQKLENAFDIRHHIEHITLESIGVDSSDGLGTYQLNLRDETCSCSDWIAVRKDYPVGHLRRICKHLARSLSDYDLASPDGFLLSILTNIHFGISEHNHFTIFEQDGNRGLLFRQGLREWCDVIAMDKESTYQKYGLRLPDCYWAQHMRPPHYEPMHEVALEWFLVVNAAA